MTHSNNRFEHAGRVYWFEWKSSYMGETDYIIHDETGSYRATLRHNLGDYERSILNYDAAGIAKHVESKIGLLVRSVCDNEGEIPAATIAAFNAWCDSEYEAAESHFLANPDRYGEESNWRDICKRPIPVSAGRWTLESGWTRVETYSIAA